MNLHQFYLPNSNSDGVFTVGSISEEFIENISIYEFEFFEGTKDRAYFKLANESSAIKIALKNVSKYIEPVCKSINFCNKNTKNVTTLENGIAIKLPSSGNWKVEKKAKIEYFVETSKCCSKCGEKISEIDKFCKNCGTNAKEAPLPEPVLVENPELKDLTEKINSIIKIGINKIEAEKLKKRLEVVRAKIILTENQEIQEDIKVETNIKQFIKNDVFCQNCGAIIEKGTAICTSCESNQEKIKIKSITNENLDYEKNTKSLDKKNDDDFKKDKTIFLEWVKNILFKPYSIILLVIIVVIFVVFKIRNTYNDSNNQHYKNDDYVKVNNDYNQAIRLVSNNALAYNSRGLEYYAKGDYDKAIEDYNKAIELDSNYALIFNNRGLAYYTKGDYDKAIEDYNKAIELDSNYVLAFNNRGLAYYNKGKIYSNITYYNNAILDFEVALQINPHNIEIQHNLEDVNKTKQNLPNNSIKVFRQENLTKIIESIPTKPKLTSSSMAVPSSSSGYIVSSNLFKDSRDGKSYKIVNIGNQVWMAENLNYNASDSKCYDNKPENCNKYGRLYDWITAKKVCPDGWHLPTIKEWDTLIATADGFIAIPGGSGNSNDGFFNNISNGYWWSASSYNAYNAYGYYFNNYDDGKNNYDKSWLFSVLCVKD